MIRKTISWLMTALILAMACPVANAGSLKAKVLEYGLFGVERAGVSIGKTDRGLDVSGLKNATLLKASNRLEEKEGISFGICYMLGGESRGKVVDITVKWLHPTIQAPNTEPFTETIVKKKTRVGARNCNFCSFYSDWMMMPGLWTIQIIHQGEVLTELTFVIEKP